jgi:transposase
MDRQPLLPDDLGECQRQLAESQRRLAEANRRVEEANQRVEEANRCVAEVGGRLEETAASLETLAREHEQLKEEFRVLSRLLFGPRRERLIESPGQQHLFEPGGLPDPVDVPPVEERVVRRRGRRRGHGWTEIPEHVPRREKLVDVPESEKVCEHGCQKVRIGEDVVEELDWERPKLFARRIVRPKYACPTHKDQGVTCAPPEPKLVEGGRFGFGIGAEVLTAKFFLHLPLYRQEDTFAASGLRLDRSTLCDIVRCSAELLRPLAERQRELVLQSEVMWTDDTPVRMQVPLQGTREARFWTYIGDAHHPYDVYDFTTNHTRDGPKRFLDGYVGYLHADAYGGYDGIYLESGGKIREVACWSHARRKFFDARLSYPREAHEALAWIRELFDIEDRAADFDALGRRALRQAEAIPILDRMEVWLVEQSRRVLPKSSLAKAITYARNQWEALRRYTEDGRLTIDNNASERRLRAQAVGRKNWLFVGGEKPGERAAVIYTVVSSAKRHDLDVWAYLRDVLEQLARGAEDLGSLLPDRWKASHPEAVRTYRQDEREAKATAKRERRRRRRVLQRARGKRR